MKTDSKLPLPTLFATLLTTLFTLSGCASAGSLYGPAIDAYLPAELAAEPPSIWVSGDWFYLDRPAYAIVFEIRAGSLPRVLYPPDSRYRQRRLRSGFHLVDRFGRASDNVPCLASPVVYQLAITSHEPLRLQELEGQVHFRYRPAFSFQLISYNVRAALDDVLIATLPGYSAGREAGWGMDYEALWVCDVSPPSYLPSAVVLASDTDGVTQIVVVDPESGGSTKEETAGENREGAPSDDTRVEALRKGPTAKPLPADVLGAKRVLESSLPERRLVEDMKRTLRPESPFEPRSRTTSRQSMNRDRQRDGERPVTPWRGDERRGTRPFARPRAQPAGGRSVKPASEKRKAEKNPDG